MSERLAAARAYVEKKPTDRFGLYALAMELRKARAWEECLETFDRLLAHHPTYGAGFYHYAMAVRESGDRERAVAILQRGLAVTRDADPKTYAEIVSALDELGIEVDD